MANEQGRYVGETIVGVIGEDVGLGQVLYCKSAPLGSDINTGVWYVASSDGDYVEPYRWISGQNQLGISLTAASASTISSTQSGTQIDILLKGYYAPGTFPFGGYCYGDIANGSPLYLMPENIPGYNTRGCIDGQKPTYYGATQGVYRVIGYAYDIVNPFVIRFEPDKTWIEI